MRDRKERLAAWIEPHRGKRWDPHYLAFFDCFNRGLFYEAHEVLESLWLRARGGADERFYKGLIQLAGGFVHLRKHRPRPAMNLFGLAESNLRLYPDVHLGVEVRTILGLLQQWTGELQQDLKVEIPAPELWLKEE